MFVSPIIFGGKSRRDLPNYVGLSTSAWATPVPALGPAYLGEKYAPFERPRREFRRTPRVNHAVGTVSKVMQPGRDHWPQAMSILFAGGGISGGQVVGATNRNGEYPEQRPLGPHDFLATIYHHLGIDAASIHLPDRTGRPVPILAQGRPIPELTAAG